MSQKQLSRRMFLRGASVTAVAALVAACQPKVVEVEKEVTRVVKEVVKETVVVAGTPKVVEKVVTAKPAPAEVITLRVMTRAGPGGGDTHRHFCKKFDEEHPNITVKTEDTPYGEAQKKQELGFITGSMQDAVFSATKWYPYGCYKTLYLPIDAYVNANPHDFDDYYPSLVEACRFEAKLYGLPGGYAHPNTRELLYFGLWTMDYISPGR